MVTLSNCPNELFFLLPFLQRANEMADSQPVMSYYCKFYAVSLALKGGPTGKFQRSPQTDSFLAKLFDDLEEAKAQLSDHSTIKDMTQGAIYVRELAYRVFLSAEKQESSPSTLKKALQSYLAAVNFLQVYHGVFLEDSTILELGEEERTSELAQIEEKSKYAKWRIVEIKKQLTSNQSIESIPTSPQTSFTGLNTQTQPVNVNHVPTSPQVSQYPQYPKVSESPQYPKVSESTQYPSVSQSPQIPQYPPHVSPPATSPVGLLYDPKILSDCEKHARHAISALNFDDVESAADNLRTALKLLQPYLKK